ncbi:hypothetical protein CYMTET_38483 [Cymbomonas tetramitiformis]|uniref:Uncharacterized protein n=1 Tax=Cymbomonas tetramitiformis TaxID=36881 RepID=A0AAE0CD81_9CHLO|nr:hypothetical protein CYMTET_38483 [Cymbomonas tetramitiformis]
MDVGTFAGVLILGTLSVIGPLSYLGVRYVFKKDLRAWARAHEQFAEVSHSVGGHNNGKVVPVDGFEVPSS